MFVDFFRSSCEVFNPQNAASDNLNNICYFGIENKSSVEVIYFFRKFQQWLKWNEKNIITQYSNDTFCIEIFNNIFLIDEDA